MNKNVIVTGANRGIGKAIVKAFANNKDNLWVFVRRESDEFNSYIADLHNKNGVWIKPVYVDLSDGEAVKKCFRQIVQSKQSVDVLVNCAGIGHMNLFQMSTMDSIRKVYEVNLFAVMQMCQCALRLMVKQKKGNILNIASTAADEVYVGNSIYGASKAAVIAFTKSLAAEVASSGIQVNAIAPGLTDTDMSQVFEGKDASLPMARSALGRKLHPDEIANVVVTMTDETMQLINGQVIVVNGGSK